MWVLWEEFQTIIKGMKGHTHGKSHINVSTVRRATNILLSLKNHKITHTGEGHSNVSFVRRASTNHNLHQITHKGERPFQHEFYDKSFKHSSNLKNHESTHTGERPFQYEFCEKSFSQSQSQFKGASNNTRVKGHSNVSFVRRVLNILQIWRTMKEHTVERSFQC